MSAPADIIRRVDALEADQARGEAGPATWKDLALMADGEEYERADPTRPAPPWSEVLGTVAEAP